MTEKPKFELKTVEGDDSPDDVHVTVNLSKLIEKLMDVEDSVRAEKRQEADRAFVKKLAKEVFRNGE